MQVEGGHIMWAFVGSDSGVLRGASRAADRGVTAGILLQIFSKALSHRLGARGKGRVRQRARRGSHHRGAVQVDSQADIAKGTNLGFQGQAITPTENVDSKRRFQRVVLRRLDLVAGK